MNIAMARELARTKDFSATRPWGNSIDMITLTEHFVARTHRTSHNVSYTLDVYSECSTATTLKLELRLIGGWRSTLGEAPPSIMAEGRRGVPSWLLGFPVIQAPRVVRFLFFLETPFPVWELDLVASHLREMMSAAITHDIPHKELAIYVRSEESVKKFREVEAKHLKVKPHDIKRLMNMIGYGNSGREWAAVHNTQPSTEIKAVQETAKRVIKVLWEGADEARRAFCSKREKPPLTNLSINAQIGERFNIELTSQQIEAHDGIVGGYIFDSVVASDFDQAKAEIVQASLKAQQILVSASRFPSSAEDFKCFAEGHLGTSLDWTPLSKQMVDATLETIEFVKWLYPVPGHKDPPRGGRPYLACARGVAPHMLYSQNRSTGKVEYFDQAAGIWKESGGEFMITGDELNRVLADKMVTYRMEMTGEVGQQKWAPVKLPASPLLKDPASLNPISGMLKTINKAYEGPLGSSPASTFQLVFAGGTTVDFDKPFDEQVRMALPSDRNNRQSAWKFQAPPLGSDARTQLGKDISDFLIGLGKADEASAGDVLVDKFGIRLIDLMKAGLDPMLQHFYYEPAGGRLDSEDPLQGLSEVPQCFSFSVFVLIYLWV